MAPRSREGRVPDDALRIRHVEPADYDAVAAAMGTPRAQSETLQLPYLHHDVWRERLAKHDPNGCLLVAEVRGTDGGWEIVASAGVHPTGQTPRRRHAAGLGMAVRDDWQGRGIGDRLIGAVVARAEGWMDVRRIELMVYVDNASAIALYRKHGFEIEGTLRAYALRNGAYVDAYAMARLHPSQPLVRQPAT